MSTFPDVKKNFGFGCMRLPMDGEKVDYAEFTKMVDEFMAQGFNYFDTARVYIGGQSETAIRDCVVKRYPRDSFILTDKLSDSLFNSEDEIRPLFEKQLESCGVEYFCHGRDGKREEFWFPGVQGVKNVLVGLIKKDTGFLVFQFVLEFLFHPLDRVNKLFRGNTHVVSGIYCCIDSCLEGFRNESHDGKHFTSFFHKEGNVDPDRAMFHAASAHGTGSEQGVNHLVACLLV